MKTLIDKIKKLFRKEYKCSICGIPVVKSGKYWMHDIKGIYHHTPKPE